MKRWLAAAMCAVSVVACSPGGSTPESVSPSTEASTSRFTPSPAPGSKPATGKGAPSPSGPQTGRVRPEPSCFGEQATILGTRLHDRIRGTDGNDVVVSLGGDDVVSGLNEKDMVCTGRGNDRVLVEQDVRVDLGPGDDVVNHVGGHGGGRIRTIRGGAGDDTILLSRNSEASVVPGPGDDRIRAARVRGEPSRTPCVRFESATGPVRVNLALGRARGQGRDRLVHIRCVVGSPFDDVLTGTDRDDLVQAGRGLDLVRTRAGNDFVDGGHEADEVHLGSGADTVLGFDGWDRLYGGPGSDIVTGLSDGDYLDGGPGDDFLYAGPACEEGAPPTRAGDDTAPNELFGRAGNDFLAGGQGDDRLDGGPGVDSGHGGFHDRRIDWITSLELVDECDTPARLYRLSDIAIR